MVWAERIPLAMGVVACALLACASSPQRGSFVPLSRLQRSALAADATQRLQASYPAGSYALQWQRAIDDGFGRAMATALQQAGYRLWGPGRGRLDARSLDYAVDQLKGTPFVRLTLYVVGRRFSRAYALTAEGVQAAGPWSDSGSP